MVDETTPVPAAGDAVPAIPVPTTPAADAVQPVTVEPVGAVAEAAPAADVAAPVPSAPPVAAAPQRRLWPFFLGGGILVLILLIVAIVVLLVNVLGSSASPAKTVTEFDRAFAEVDCELFQKTTTADFQDSFFGEAFTCDPWVANAQGLQVDGEYAYTVVVGDTTVDGEVAEVTTTETDSSSDTPTVYNLDYHLVKSDGVWLIDGIENLDG